jgi:hypothetical protein
VRGAGGGDAQSVLVNVLVDVDEYEYEDEYVAQPSVLPSLCFRNLSAIKASSPFSVGR